MGLHLVDHEIDYFESVVSEKEDYIVFYINYGKLNSSEYNVGILRAVYLFLFFFISKDNFFLLSKNRYVLDR